MSSCYFIWKGENSNKYGILERLPLDLRAERVTQIIDMPNSMPIVYQTKAFKAQQCVLNFGLRDTSDKNISEINNWLSGTGELIFSNDLDKYYKAVCFGAMQGTRMVQDLGKLSVNFTVMPGKYAISNEWEEVHFEDNDDAWIPYAGTLEAEPTIKLYGNGNMKFRWSYNMIDIEIRNVSEYCIIDIPSRRVYDKNGNVILNETIGDLMRIEMYGPSTWLKRNQNIDRMEIKKNTRWL